MCLPSTESAEVVAGGEGVHKELFEYMAWKSWKVSKGRMEKSNWSSETDYKLYL